MPKIVHKQKSPFGGEVYLDENFRVIGPAQKGLFGETVYLDRNWKVKGYSRKTSLGNTVYVDKDYHYKGRGGSIGEEEYLLLEEDREDACEAGRRGIGAGFFLIVLLVGIVFVLQTVLK